ncbi:hypothetical protein Tco_0034233, partial [Tanacetum coccineum]
MAATTASSFKAKQDN